MQAADIRGTAFKNGSATLLARVVGDGTPIEQADISAAEYSVYELDDHDPDSQTVVEGHDGVSLTVSSLIFDTLQTDDLWDVDSVGYNLKHVLDVSTKQAFATAGKAYRIIITLTPVSGQEILVRFRVRAI